MVTKNIKGDYEGYLWESDKQIPHIFKGERTLKEWSFNNEANPFIIEGQLFDKNTGHSISIKYVDGQYKIKEYYIKVSNDGNKFFVLKKDNNDGETECEVKCEVIERHYKGNSKLDGTLHFYELWEEECDPNCCNMKVLKATKVIFAGFEK